MSRLALLFPGQGAQHPGMGRELHDDVPEARAVFEAADRALGTPLSRICFEGPAERLALTETTQPALLTVGVAAWRALEAAGVRPDGAAGHSLGEYAAHVAAGTMAFDDAVRAVRERGRFMQQAVPVGEGAMAAVLGLDAEAVAAACAGASDGRHVAPANLNGPRQVVIAGHAEAVARAGELAREAGARRVVPLEVSAPFHCALMRPAADRLAPVLDAIEFADPGFPVYANVTGSPVGDAAAARRLLVDQVASPVRWVETIERMLEDGFDTFVEVGAGSVLAGLMRGIRRGVTVLPARTPDEVAAVAATLAGAR